MRLSEKKQSDLYGSIREPIVDLRVSIERDEVTDIDYALFRLETEIWNRVRSALALKGTQP